MAHSVKLVNCKLIYCPLSPKIVIFGPKKAPKNAFNCQNPIFFRIDTVELCKIHFWARLASIWIYIVYTSAYFVLSEKWQKGPLFPFLHFSWLTIQPICKNHIFPMQTDWYCPQKKYKTNEKVPGTDLKNCKKIVLFFSLFLLSCKDEALNFILFRNDACIQI